MMESICPRLQLLEINDQSWFPAYFREKVQLCLTLVWTLRLPLIQTASPAQLVASVLSSQLSSKRTQYTYVDFCAGAGGPTPTIEQHFNEQLRSSAIELGSGKKTSNGYHGAVDFILTDLHPHLEAWKVAAAKSDNLGYITESVDAANAPKDLIKKDGKKIFRLFNLAFHHFDDTLAKEILRNSAETADGFGIFELQARTFSSIFTILLMWPLLLLVSPIYFWRSPGHLFFTYIIPVIPFVVVFDGIISSIRTRTAKEVIELLSDLEGLEGWELRDGKELHTWPTGHMTWFIGVRGGFNGQ